MKIVNSRKSEILLCLCFFATLATGAGAGAGAGAGVEVAVAGVGAVEAGAGAGAAENKQSNPTESDLKAKGLRPLLHSKGGKDSRFEKAPRDCPLGFVYEPSTGDCVTLDKEEESTD